MARAWVRAIGRPQTLHALLDYEIPGFGEQMRAFGRTKTPMADLSRSLAGVLGSTLVIAVPGSESGATESLQAVEPLLDHALETLARPYPARRRSEKRPALMVEHVPLYPLAPLLFLASAVAVRAAHGAPPARLGLRAAGPTVRDEPGRLRRAVQVRHRAGAHVPRPGCGDHARDDLLGLRDPDRRHGRPGHLRPRPHDPGRHPGWLAVAAAAARPEPVRARRAGDGRLRALPAAGVALSAAARPCRATRWSSCFSSAAWCFGVVRGGLPHRRVWRSRRGLGGAWPTRYRSALHAVFSQRLLQAGYGLFFWANVALVSFFLVYLPRSKHLHIVTAFFNAALRKMRPRGELPAMDLEAQDAQFGVKTIEDLSWKDLLDGFTCTECGRCQEACPAWATGKPLNPKTMIMGIREMSVEVGGGRAAHPVDQAVARAGHAGGLEPRPSWTAAIPYDAVWDCVTCGACVEACPVHDRARRQDRRPAAQPGARGIALPGGAHDVVQQHGALLEHLGPAAKRRASTGPSRCRSRCRLPRRWSRVAPDAVAELECLYWVGCAASFDDRNRRVARAVVTCLNAAGVKYAVLGQEESCTGDPARRMGNEYVFQMLAHGQRRDAQPVQAEDDHHGLSALLQHDRQ